MTSIKKHETEYETAALYDPGFYNHCGDLFLPDTALVWLILRTLKYEFVTDLTVAQYIWYHYYLPMLFIPLLVYIALTLGKSEEHRLTKRTGFLVAVPDKIFAKNRRSFTICLQLKGICPHFRGQTETAFLATIKP